MPSIIIISAIVRRILNFVIGVEIAVTCKPALARIYETLLQPAVATLPSHL